ncbi:hypothetical protein PC128_g21440 [Phytophthora cactorum]|nr:hypothetical protein PC120_g6302 [Phytophthora cactorum]KAG3079221.1 hypothetical protein PC121_g7039 [Phytophthora cactorum]KAG3158705.1 hypothetical protein PC128_g21440 [Phytophthora cactorum]
MARLGYSDQDLLDQARLVADVYDMDEPATMGGMCGVLSDAKTTTEPTQTPEDEEIRPEESQSCFPEVDIHQDCEEARALEWSILEEKLEEATTLGCSECFRKELAQLLTEYRDVFRMKLGRDLQSTCPHSKSR